MLITEGLKGLNNWWAQFCTYFSDGIWEPHI